MACYNPLKGFIVGKTENGKNDLKITPYDTECIYQPLGTNVWERHGYKLDPRFHHGRIVTEFVPIPCGQCVGCRLEYARQWAIRCMLESESYDQNYFLTLTYDDEHLPKREYIDDDGVIQVSYSLVKKHLQKFCKDLRSALSYRDKPSFRFFASGEYGDRSMRPHYHMISFGLELDDLVKYKDSRSGTLYTSEFLSGVWKRGYVIIGSVTFESCSYVARYIMKKQKGSKDADPYATFSLTPPFTLMSRRPGVGKEYFEKRYNDIYSIDKIVLEGGRCVRPPRYFDNLFDDIDHEMLESVKEQRKEVTESIQSYKDFLITADYKQQLQFGLRNKEAQIKALARSL